MKTTNNNHMTLYRDPQPVPTLLQLGRAYSKQASRNFVRDGILLAVFGALSAWAIIHAIQAMAG